MPQTPSEHGPESSEDEQIPPTQPALSHCSATQCTCTGKIAGAFTGTWRIAAPHVEPSPTGLHLIDLNDTANSLLLPSCPERCEGLVRPVFSYSVREPLRGCTKTCVKEVGHERAHNCRDEHEWNFAEFLHAKKEPRREHEAGVPEETSGQDSNQMPSHQLPSHQLPSHQLPSHVAAPQVEPSPAGQAREALQAGEAHEDALSRSTYGDASSFWQQHMKHAATSATGSSSSGWEMATQRLGQHLADASVRFAAAGRDADAASETRQEETRQEETQPQQVDTPPPKARSMQQFCSDNNVSVQQISFDDDSNAATVRTGARIYDSMADVRIYDSKRVYESTNLRIYEEHESTTANGDLAAAFLASSSTCQRHLQLQLLRHERSLLEPRCPERCEGLVRPVFYPGYTPDRVPLRRCTKTCIREVGHEGAHDCCDVWECNVADFPDAKKEPPREHEAGEPEETSGQDSNQMGPSHQLPSHETRQPDEPDVLGSQTSMAYGDRNHQVLNIFIHFLYNPV